MPILDDTSYALEIIKLVFEEAMATGAFVSWESTTRGIAAAASVKDTLVTITVRFEKGIENAV